MNDRWDAEPRRAEEAPTGGVRPVETDGLAISSLALSILWLGGLGSILAIILGTLGRRNIRSSNGTKSGEGIATAGIIVGTVGLVPTVLIVGLLAAATLRNTDEPAPRAAAAPVATTTQASSSQDDPTPPEDTTQPTPTDSRGYDWPESLGGRPPALGKRNQRASSIGASVDREAGTYFWNDYDGWHLWVVGIPAGSTVTGTITSNSEFGRAVAAVPDSGDVVVSGKTITFSLPGGEPVSGVDFNPGFYGKHLVVKITSPDSPTEGGTIRLGKAGTKTQSPLVVDKEG